jgi:hypothetical protein
MPAPDEIIAAVDRHEAQTDPRDRARWDIQRRIIEVARKVFGAAVVHTPIEGFTHATREEVKPAILGVQAAVFVRDVAARWVREHAMTARGAGYSWDQVGAALGLKEDEDPNHSAGDRAFMFLVWGELHPRPGYSWSRNAYWTCGSCKQQVTDHGPFDANPANTETGHAGSCERHHSDCLAYHEEWDD